MNKKCINNFDRIGDWKKFNERMLLYIEVPVKKYGSEQKFNDLLHYTGLRVICWNILKYALRLWTGAGKINDFEKIAHYAQIGWTLKTEQGRTPPFFGTDCDGDYIVIRVEKKIEDKSDAEKFAEVTEILKKTNADLSFFDSSDGIQKKE